MKSFIIVLLVAATSAGRLENTYLPPNSARLAGGSGSILSAPSSGVTNAVSSSYGAPIAARTYPGAVPAPVAHSAGFAARVSPPSAAYGVPLPAVQTYAAPVTPPVPIVRLNNDNNGDGSYRYDYETANHISAQEEGQLTGAGSSAVHGSYSYLAPNGETVSVNYVADENGFRPEGAHLPTPPPIPEEILKSLQINAAEEARAGSSHGAYSGAGVSSSTQYLPPVAEARQGGYRY